MPPSHNTKENAHQPTIYEIKVEGHLDRQWTDWFGGVTVIVEEDGNTRLACPVVDQAALHGLLKKVRDLGIPLISVNRIGSGQTKDADIELPVQSREAHKNFPKEEE